MRRVLPPAVTSHTKQNRSNENANRAGTNKVRLRVSTHTLTVMVRKAAYRPPPWCSRAAEDPVRLTTSPVTVAQTAGVLRARLSRSLALSLSPSLLPSPTKVSERSGRRDDAPHSLTSHRGTCGNDAAHVVPRCRPSVGCFVGRRGRNVPKQLCRLVSPD